MFLSVLCCKIIPVTIRTIPPIVERSIFSPTIILMKKRERKGH
jgi:hypothetical protein